MSDKQETPKCPYCGLKWRIHEDEEMWVVAHSGRGLKAAKCVLYLTQRYYRTEAEALAAAQLRPLLRYAGESLNLLKEIDEYGMPDMWWAETGATYNDSDKAVEPLAVRVVALLAKTKEAK